MSKWTKTYVVVSGTDRTLLNKLYKILTGIYGTNMPNCPKTFSYDDLIKALNLSNSSIICSATGENLRQESDGVIKWEDSFNGIAPNDVYKAIASVFKGLKVIYCGLDENEFPCITNDVDGLYFPQRYVLVEDMDGSFCKSLFNTFEELSDYISDYYGVSLSSPGDIQTFNNRYPNSRISEIEIRKTQYLF